MPLDLALRSRLALGSRTRETVSLDPSRLTRHAAVLAQSGSGKSFMLGRLVEELALKTKARIIVFDPNSDFIRLNEPDLQVWQNGNLVPWLFPGDTSEAFVRAWKKIPISIASNRNLANARNLVLDWGSLDSYEAASVMKIDPQRESDMYWCLFLVCQIAKETWEDAEEPYYDFDHFREQSDNLVKYLLGGTATPPLADNPLAKTLSKSVTPHTALRYAAFVNSVAEYQIWRSKGDGQVDVRTLVSSSENVPRILVVDLQSLAREEEKIAITSHILDALWEKGRRELWESIRDFRKPDTRVPTFVVIDEAHNLVPEQKDNPGIRRLGAEIVRIASEGRKYGISLVVATQRPRKIDTSVLTECDNLFLMRMTNESDMNYAEKAFGFLSRKKAEKARSLKVGEMLLAGAVDTGSNVLHASPRRTVQGGRGISESYWTSSPD